MTAINICKTNEFDDSVFLKAHCSCGSDDHIQTLILEKDEWCVSLTIYSKAFTKYYQPYNETFIESIKYWFNVNKRKISYICDIIFKGYVEVENEFIFSNPQAIEDYIEALTEAKNKYKEDLDFDSYISVSELLKKEDA